MPRKSRLPAEQLSAYLIEAPHPRSAQWRVLSQKPQSIDWRALFGNDRPVEIEVGFGKGLFLVNQSLVRPNVNFLGIEIEGKYAMLTAARLARHNIANVRLVCTDARWLLKECVPAGSVQALYVFFPDPWWKQRHRKRKLMSADFIGHCARVLRAGGILHFVTDVAEYFEETCTLLRQEDLLAACADGASLSAEAYRTNFERKYRQEGRAIYSARYERRVQPMSADCS